MLLYKGKGDLIVPRMSQQEAIEIQLSVNPRIPIFRGSQQVGYFDRALNIVAWDIGVEFTDDGEHVSLFKPEQGA